MSEFIQQYELDKHHQMNQQRQAEQHRLVMIAREGRTKSPRRFSHIYKPTLYRLGKQLESIGTRLQVRYGDLKPATIPQSDSDCQPGMAC